MCNVDLVCEDEQESKECGIDVEGEWWSDVTCGCVNVAFGKFQCSGTAPVVSATSTPTNGL